MAEIFTRRQIVNAALGGAAATLWNGTARATLPIPPPIPLEEYIKEYGELIFTGYFNRVVAITRELSGKLFKSEECINQDELQVHNLSEISDPGEIFFEITNVDLRLINKKNISLGYVKKCKFKKIYCYGFDLYRTDEMSAYYRSLMGKDVVLLLSPEGHYGRNAVKFPEPFFRRTSAGGNWRDGASMHISKLGQVIDMAKKAGYIEPPRGICGKAR